MIELEQKGFLSLPVIPEDCTNNAHMFYIKVKDLNTRTQLITHLKKNRILSVFHYVPLHSSQAGRKFGRMSGEDVYTTMESERLIRLPLFYGLTSSELNKITDSIYEFFEGLIN